VLFYDRVCCLAIIRISQTLLRISSGVYTLGLATFCRVVDVGLYHLARDGIIVPGVLAGFASKMSPLMLSLLTTAILIVVAVWEMLSLRTGVPEQEAQSSLERRTGNSGCDVG